MYLLETNNYMFQEIFEINFLVIHENSRNSMLSAVISCIFGRVK